MIKHLLDSAMADIDLFSLAKIISNSASGLVGYYFARLNKSRYLPSPCPISVYYELYLSDHHNVKVEESGLFLDKSFPFVGATPDRIISCSCCGNACLEVKCLYSINYTSPDAADVFLPYLKRSNGKITLNRSRQYFTQCQVQIGVTGLNSCYFFIWTQHGFVIEKIQFEIEFWNDLKKKF